MLYRFFFLLFIIVFFFFFTIAEKEIQAVHNDANTKEQLLTGKEERTRVTVETDELHSALVNHRIVRDLYQKSVFNTQVLYYLYSMLVKDKLTNSLPPAFSLFPTLLRAFCLI